MTNIDFYFDCASPWTYLAFETIEAVSRHYRVQIDYKPVLAGGIFNAVNPSVYHVRENVPAKVTWGRADLRQWQDMTGIEFRFPPPFHPVNSVQAMRSCIVAARQNLLIPYARKLFEAYHRDWRDIADPAVLGDLASDVGMDPLAFRDMLGEERVKQELRALTDEAIARGAFGSPTFFLGKAMFFGVDRIRNLTFHLERARSPQARYAPFWCWAGADQLNEAK
ncbi:MULTISPECIES: 2-hydroxychromene-2-carboxylate isomerase [Sphingobium]|uniref:2-hydroxychromene-2-carboxylate isomerase n=1 Tax=Sphingobium TaxID=165695 RepID=UPI00159C17D7|nr:2-hydroxychromene-2-carboxylate isomerase [Sphingobium sp. 15-1]